MLEGRFQAGGAQEQAECSSEREEGERDGEGEDASDGEEEVLEPAVSGDEEVMISLLYNSNVVQRYN